MLDETVRLIIKHREPDSWSFVLRGGIRGSREHGRRLRVWQGEMSGHLAFLPSEQ